MSDIKTKPTEQEMISAINRLIGKLKEYADEDSLANEEGRGCFEDPNLFVNPAINEGHLILNRFYYGQPIGDQPTGWHIDTTGHMVNVQWVGFPDLDDAKKMIERAEELFFALRPGVNGFHSTLIDKWVEDAQNFTNTTQITLTN